MAAVRGTLMSTLNDVCPTISDLTTLAFQPGGNLGSAPAFIESINPRPLSTFALEVHRLWQVLYREVRNLLTLVSCKWSAMRCTWGDLVSHDYWVENEWAYHLRHAQVVFSDIICLSESRHACRITHHTFIRYLLTFITTLKTTPCSPCLAPL
jgi:hypothetical protein